MYKYFPKVYFPQVYYHNKGYIIYFQFFSPWLCVIISPYMLRLLILIQWIWTMGIWFYYCVWLLLLNSKGDSDAQPGLRTTYLNIHDDS